MIVRGYEIVLGFLIASVFWAGILAWQSQQNSYAQDQSQQQKQTPQPDAAEQQTTAQPLRLPSNGEQAIKTNWGNPECSKPQNHDEADLCEQRRMAKAAEDAVWLGKVQLGVGVVGAFLLFLTLYYSRKATNAAMLAAKAADLSARAAVRLELPIIHATPPILWTSAELETPTEANPIEIAMGWDVNYPSDTPRYIWNRILRPRARIPANGGEGSFDVGDFWFELNDYVIDQIRKEEMALWLYGYIAYTDFMDEYHEAGFCWRWDIRRT